MKQIEPASSRALHDTGTAFRPQRNSAAPDASPLTRAACKANKTSEAARGVPCAGRSSARRVASSSFERNQRSAT
jgi:hypothetical protein